MIVTSCPHCRAKLKIEDQLAGHDALCPKCQQPFTVPTAPAPPVAPPPVPGAPPRAAIAPPPIPVAAPTAGPPVRPPPIPAVPSRAVPPPIPALSARPMPPPIPPVTASPAPAAIVAPTAAVTPATSRSSQDLLAAYQSGTSASGTTMAQRLSAGAQAVKQGAHAVKLRAQALKLKYDIKRLNAGLDEQCERLGTLVLQHRPPALDLTADLAELGRLQDESSQKQTTQNSLRGTKGGGGVMRDLQRELTASQAAQRQLMLGLGRRALAQRLELPGAAGHYSAIDRLSAALAPKDAELKSIEQQIGPVLDAATLGSVKRPALYAGMAAGGLLVVWLLWAFLLRGWLLPDIPRWAQFAIPNQAKLVARVDLKKLHDGPLGDALGRAIPKSKPAGPADLHLDHWNDISEIVLALSDPAGGPEVIAYRTREDVSLDELVPKPTGGRKNASGIDYVQYEGSSGKGYVARVAARTYCESDSEDRLRAALKRYADGAHPQLSADVRSAMRAVRGHDLWVAGEVNQDLPPPFSGRLKFSGVGVTSGNQLRCSGRLTFAKDKDAEEFASQFSKLADMVRMMARSGAPPALGKTMSRAADLLGQLTLKPSGAVVNVSGRWDNADVESLIKDIAGGGAGMLQGLLPTPRTEAR